MARVKLMMTWDIVAGHEEEYFEFHIQRFVPALEEMGLELHEAWLTVYSEGSDQPRLLAEATANNMAAAQRVLASTNWRDLNFQIMDLVENFEYKVVPFKTRWQM